MKRDVLLLPLLLLVCGCASGVEEQALLLPRPIENALAADAESFQKKERKAWFEERHKAPPEVDWRAVERANGLRQIAKRNALAASVQPRALPRWTERGSDNQAGRMHVAVPSSDGQSLYAGSSKGGVWKGNLDGTGWVELGDNLYGGAHWLGVVPGALPGDPDVLLAATDDGLIHVTRDEGETWVEPTGLDPGTSAVHRVVVTSDGSSTAYLVRRRAGASSRQLFRSTDALASFQKVLGFGQFQGDVWVPRIGGSDAYALTSSGVQKSTDGGDTWSLVGPPPTAGMSGGELVGSEAGAPRLWVVAHVGSQRDLYRSDDAGVSWTFVQTITDYWGSLNASIVDADTFAYGGVECFVTTDAGASFSKVNGWGEYYGNPAGKLHADIPGIDVVFDGVGEVWYVSTDGGLYGSFDQLASVQNLSLNGLRVSQYYTTHTSSVDPHHVLAGSQDQGYQRASIAPDPATKRYGFDQLISGDYGHLTSADGDHDYVFSVYPSFVLCQRGENVAWLHQESFPAGETLAWMPPVVADPYDEKDYLLCATRIWRYDRIPSVRDWGGALHSTFDFSAGQPNRYASALAFSPVDPERAYAATNDGRLFRSDDHGVTWTQSAGIGPSAHYFYGTAIVASALDVDTVYVGGSGYGSPAVYRSVDGGQTFQPWGDGLPSTLVYALAEARDGTLVCGTETSAYRRDPGAAAWRDITGNEAPVTIYWSVELLPHEDTMRFGTYGRGIWDYRLNRQRRQAGGLQLR